MDDGDFEYWQPCCYENDEEKRIEAMSLKPDKSLDSQSFEYRRQKKRIFWIQVDLFHQMYASWSLFVHCKVIGTVLYLETFVNYEPLIRNFYHCL